MADVRADLEFDLSRAFAQVDQLEQRVRSASGGIDVDLEGFDRATRQADELGDSVGEVDDRLQDAEQSADGMSAALKRGVQVLVAAGAARAIRSIVEAASDLEESTSKAGQVFGDAFGQVEQAAQSSAQSVGLAQDQYLEAAGTLGNLFVAQGLAGDAAAQMSTNIVQLAADLASFNNIEVAEATDKLRSGLIGEIEPLRSLGVSFNAAAVEAKAMELGLADASGVIDDAAKIQARYALILEQTTTAQGDFALTSDGLANSLRILGAEARNAQIEIGQALLPVTQELVGVARDDLLPAMRDLGVEAAPLLVEAFRALEPAMGVTLDLIGALAPIVGLLADTIEVIPDPVLQFGAALLVVNRGLRALEGIDLLTRSVSSLAPSAAAAGGSLRSLGTTLRANLGRAAMAGAVAGLVIIQNELSNTRSEAQSLADEFQRGLQVPATIGGVDSFQQMQTAARLTREEVERLRQVELESSLGDQFRRTFELLPGVDKDRLLDRELLNQAETDLEELEQALLNASRNISQASRQIEDELGFDVDRQQILDLAESVGVDLTGAADVVVPKLLEAARASGELRGQQDEAAAATDRLTEAINEQIERARALADPVFGLVDAANSYEDAQVAANEAIAEFGPDSREAQAANRDLVDALLNLQGAATDAELDFDAFERQLDQWVAQGRITEGQAQSIRASVDDARRAAEEYEGDYEARARLVMEGLEDLARLQERLDELERAGVNIPVRLTDPETGRTVTSGSGGGGFVVEGAQHGGIFDPVPGGHIIRIAEAGAPEVVIPLDDPLRARQLAVEAGLVELIGAAGPAPTRSRSPLIGDLTVNQTVVAPDPARAGTAAVADLRDEVYLRTGVRL